MGRFKEHAPARLPDGWQAHVHSLNRLHNTIVGQSGHGASPPDLLPAELRGDPSHCAFASALEQELAWRCVVSLRSPRGLARGTGF